VTRPSAALLAGIALLAFAPARADDPAPPDTTGLEPPPEVAEGADYEVERADSLAEDDVELGYSARGSPGARPRRSRRVRFRGDGFAAATREGADDPLSGSGIEAAALGGQLSAGRLAPRWARGLVLGSPAEPWARAAADRGDQARYLGRSGEGFRFQRAGAATIETLAGRFARRDLAGARVAFGGVGLGVLGAPRGERQVSLGVTRGGGSAELALGRAGRWRAEAGIVRRAGRGALAGHVRGGLAGFRSLAEPQRSGPAQAAAVTLALPLGPTTAEAPAGTARLAAVGALWRFRPGLTGARGALEVRSALAQHGGVAMGFEEQRGVRREPTSLHAAGRFRQGLWGEWRGGPPALSLALRHEVWGERRFARRTVRIATAARAEARGPLGSGLAIAHTVYRVRPGESLYLAEAEGDRLILRSLSGAGERTRIECRTPAGGGDLRAALSLSTAAWTPTRAQWTLDWTRRARARGKGAARGP
jgi:hypothetical protein